MERSARRTALIVGLVLGVGMAAATLALEQLASSWIVILLFPGLLFSMIVSGNVHAFPLSIAAIGNLLFWLVICWLIGWLIAELRGRPTSAGDPDASTTG